MNMMSSLSAKKLFTTLERMRFAVDSEEHEWADRLRMPVESYRSLASMRKGPPVDAIFELSEQFDLSFENIRSGNIDFALLAKRARGKRDELPEKYAHSGFSRRRTSISLLKYIEDFWGVEQKIEYLQHFQLNEAVFADPERTISLQFLVDLCDKIAQDGADSAVLFNMGAYSAFVNHESMLPLLKANGIRTNPELHDWLISDFANKFFDRNYRYEVTQLSNEGCSVRVIESDEVKDSMKLFHLGSPRTCALRAGTIASVATYLSLPISRIRKTGCVHLGDHYCTYQVTFEQGSCRDEVRQLLHTAS